MMVKKILLLALCIWSFAAAAAAALPENLQYNGVKLGDSYETMENLLGEPLVDITRTTAGQQIVYYTYKHNDVFIGIKPSDGQVADMIIRDKNFVLPGNVRLGATLSKLIREYGRGMKLRIDGLTNYVYTDDTPNGQGLYLEMNEGYLREIRISSLNLADFEEQK